MQLAWRADAVTWKRALLLGVLCALLGTGFAASAASTDDLNLPQELPDGSKLVSVKDVFTEVADAATAEQLRANMPHVLGGTEYRYTAERDGEVVSDWGIIVFRFSSPAIAKGALQELSAAEAWAGKGAASPRTPDADRTTAADVLLQSPIQDGCLLGDVVVLAVEYLLVFIDDYGCAVPAKASRERLAEARCQQALLGALDIAVLLYPSARASPAPEQPASSLDQLNAHDTLGSLRVVVTDEEGKPVRFFHRDRNAWLFQYSSQIYARTSESPFLDLARFESYGASMRPTAPQDLNAYERSTPSVWFDLFPLDTALEGPLEVYSLEPGSAEKVIANVKPGRYLVRAGTIIQVDERGVLNTRVLVQPLGQTPMSLPQVLPGRDEKGSYDVFRLESIGEGYFDGPLGITKNYTYQVLKRYTYYTWSSTITCVSPGEPQDTAYIPLLTNTDALGKLAGGAESIGIHQEDLGEQLTNASARNLAAGAFRRAISKPGDLALGLLGKSWTATILVNLFCLATNPNTKLDEDLLLKLGASLACSAASWVALLSVAANPVAGFVLSFSVGLVCSVATDEILAMAKRDGVRKRAAQAFGDDLAVVPKWDDSGTLRGLSVTCYGLEMHDPFVRVRAPVLVGNEIVHKARDITATPHAGIACPCDSTSNYVQLSLLSPDRLPPDDVWHGHEEALLRDPCCRGQACQYRSAEGKSPEILLVVDVPATYCEEAECTTVLFEDIELPLCDLIERKAPEPPEPPEPPQPPPHASATVLVIDISSSMADRDLTGKTKLEAAKEAAQNFIQMFALENESSTGAHRLGIVTFTNSASRALELTADARQASAVVFDLQPQKRTNLVDALSLANDMLASTDPAAKRIIVLLSDGVPNVSVNVKGSLKDFQNEVSLGPVAAAALKGTCLHVVGFGKPGETRSNGDPSIDEGFLRTIALATGCGEYYPATNAGDLRKVYLRVRHTSLGVLRQEATGQIRQGETAMVGTVSVPPNQDELHYTLDWPGSRLDPLLVDPQGRVVDGTYPGATVAIHPTMAHVIVLNPLAGEWRMGVAGTDVPEGTVEYQALLSTRGEVTFDFATFLGSLVSLLLTMLLLALLAALGVP
jgi:uncharacterized protein YegL